MKSLKDKAVSIILISFNLSWVMNMKTNYSYSKNYVKVLYSCLCEKFPESKEKDLLKTVGNLLYFKYMNPVIISPDR